MRYTLTVAILALSVAPAFAGEFTHVAKAQCTTENGLKWVEADEFVSAKTGKVKKQNEGCRIDRKAATAIVKARLAKQ